MIDERERLEMACDEALRETYVADQAIVDAMAKAAAASRAEDEARAIYTNKLAALAQARLALREYDETHKEGGR